MESQKGPQIILIILHLIAVHITLMFEMLIMISGSPIRKKYKIIIIIIINRLNYYYCSIQFFISPKAGDLFDIETHKHTKHNTKHIYTICYRKRRGLWVGVYQQNCFCIHATETIFFFMLYII